ncbi:MAG: ATP-binding protein, partial [Spirochaetia bacterium]
MKHFFLAFTLLMVLVACALLAEAQGTSSDFVPVTDSMLQNPDPADWLMWRRTLDGWGYSPLDQVDRENVSELRMVWSQALVQEGSSQQGTPLVYDGILYMPNPHDVIRALNAVTGERIWEYRRKWPEDLTTFLRDPGRKRNQAIYGNLIIA